MSKTINVPFDIDMNFKSYCEGCTMSKLVINSVSIIADNGIQSTINELTCKNIRVCGQLINHLKEIAQES